MINWTLFAAFALLVFLKFAIDKLSSVRHGPYPPGPKPKPLIGNMFDFPIKEASEVYMEWGRKYGSTLIISLAFKSHNVDPGDVLYGSAFGNHVVILNKWKDAEELLENRSAKYSDRPWIPLIDKYVYHIYSFSNSYCSL
jgi:hypothetical protein